MFLIYYRWCKSGAVHCGARRSTVLYIILCVCRVTSKLRLAFLVLVILGTSFHVFYFDSACCCYKALLLLLLLLNVIYTLS